MRFLKSIENQTLLAIFLGVLAGLYLPDLILRLHLLGEVFLRLLKMTIAPLIFASVYVSAAGLGSLRRLKEIGLKTLFYYLLTTSLAVLTGLVMVNLLKPGASPGQVASSVSVKGITFSDLVLGLIPQNPVKCVAEGEVLPIIFFALLFGFATLVLPPQKRTLLFDFFEALNDALIVLIRWIIRLTPLGVFAIVGGIVAEKGLSPLFQLSEYVLTVVLGLGFHAVVTLGAILYFLGGERPWAYFWRVREAIFVAFSTASSSATLPISLEVAEEKGGVPKKIAGFVLPLGATINMDGTALYEAVAAMFIA
ncbi:MAG: dicarboxylate/amino acid:cation symporter, partial [Thermodesulfobacteria bacterium]|nr:dicarboxylate/amino acid:cation symporter [Thermodesulfobacteriota bacterium]